MALRRSIIPAQNRRTQEFDVEGAATFLDGAIVLKDASEDIIEASADPAAILGFAAGPAAGRTVDAGKTLVHLAGANRTFWVEAERVPTKDDIGKVFGTAAVGGVWGLDTTEATTKPMHVVDVDIERGLFECDVVAANIQA